MKDMRLLITGGSGFIGTNLIELLLVNKIYDFINVDRKSPHNSAHNSYWVSGNIMNRAKLVDVFTEFKPTHVLHLAAKTDTASNIAEDYTENTEGTSNVIYAIENTSSVIHAVITSTQYVYKAIDPIPSSDEHFEPHTMYGISKKITEELTRNSSMKSAWTIIRPTNVWGPWHMRYPIELLRIIDKGWYFHPNNVDPVKSYAYVKNVVHQILSILKAPIELVNKQVYYVGDPSMHSIEWLNAFSEELTGKKIRTVPKSLIYLLSYMGSFMNKLNLHFPLNLARFENMKDDYDTPISKTINTFGLSHPSLKDNVKETVDWIKNDGKSFFDYWKNK